jgi:Flp pilus assembly protein TadG
MTSLRSPATQAVAGRSLAGARSLASGVTRRTGGERGDAGPLELVILIPALLLLFGLVVAFGRTTVADSDVEHAARVGARAAASAQTSSGGRALANEVVLDSLHHAGMACMAGPSVTVTGSWTPGGRVVVTVSCTASLADVTSLGLPGARTLRATATEVIDRTRGGP